MKPMSIEDFDEVYRLWQNTEGIGLNESDSRPNVASFLVRNPGMSFVARSDDEIIGAVLCGHDGRRGYLHHLAVAKEHRKKGIGKGLLEACFSQLAAAGILKCSIFVFNDNADGESFWQHHGWTKRNDLRLMQKAVIPAAKSSPMKTLLAIVLVIMACLVPFAVDGQASAPARERVKARVEQEYPSLFELYKHLHLHPELSFAEEKTSARVAEELRKAGYEVTTSVGKHGVVGLLRNGNGPTVLVRTDMDALPVKEQTGLPYASTVTAKDPDGKEVPVMHACGHDMNMTCVLGAARVLAHLKDQWHGTLVVIGQPAEERGGGARAMLGDGLFTRFPRPDFCLALHDNAEVAAGKIAYASGFALANVDSVDVTIRGVGGHGAYPHKTKDPVVLAAQIVLDLQTIVSREIEPGEPAVVTVGSIHGGTKHNIIPDEVHLQLTVRSYTDEVRQQILSAIRRIVRGQALAAGIPEDRLPEVKLSDEFTPATYNDPQLTGRLAATFTSWFGETNVIKKKPTMGGEDFGEYGRTADKIPICIFYVGGVRPEALRENEQTGKPLPSLHSPLWAPLPEPTIKGGVTAMTAAVLELTREL